VNKDEFEPFAKAVVERISYKQGYRLIIERDKKDEKGRLYIQVECDRPDCYTLEIGKGRGGKAYLSEHMTVSEIVRLAFGLFKAYEEHECREWFKYADRAVFGPHIDVEAMWTVADTFDFRSRSGV